MRLSVLLPTLAALAPLVLQACRHQPEPPAVWVAPDQPTPLLALAPTPLADALQVERLAESWSLLGADEEGLASLQQAARGLPKERLQSDSTARRLVALAVFRMVHGPGLSQRFDAVRGLVDALQAAAPEAAETIFCRAYLRFVLLQDDGGELSAGGLERKIVVDLERELALLAERHPEFDGPGDWTRLRIVRERTRLQRLLSALAMPAAVTPVGTSGAGLPGASSALGAP